MSKQEVAAIPTVAHDIHQCNASRDIYVCQHCGDLWTDFHTCTVQQPAQQPCATEPAPDTQIKLLELKVRLLELRAQLLDRPQFAELISALEAEIAQFTSKAANHVW